jgi:hypothetical protein
MLTRRKLLTSVFTGSAAFVGGAAAARAFSTEPMPADLKAAYALRCGGGNADGHDALMRSARTTLDGQIAQGLKPAGSQEIVVCPICGCAMVVSADSNL